MHLAAYERALRARGRSANTITGYLIALNQLATYSGCDDVTDLEQADIEKWMSYLINDAPRRRKAAGHHQHSSPGIKYRQIRAFYNWCVEEEIIESSPMRRMREPKALDAPVPILDDTQLRALLKDCAGTTFEARRDTALIRLWCEPGSPRVAEMAGILVDDLELRQGMVTVRGKGGKIRVIPYGARTGQAIDRYLRARTKHRDHRSPALWLAARQGIAITPSGLAQMLRRRAARAGIGHVHPHQLRHTSAHQWADAGGNEGDAMALFGWSSPEMPKRYGASARIERAQRAARRISPADRL